MSAAGDAVGLDALRRHLGLSPDEGDDTDLAGLIAAAVRRIEVVTGRVLRGDMAELLDADQLALVKRAILIWCAWSEADRAGETPEPQPFHWLIADLVRFGCD